MRSTPLILNADPRAGFMVNEEKIRAAIDRVLTSGRYILGPEVEAFEHEFAEYLGGGFLIGVASGTDAIELALRAAGVQEGDPVATVSNTVTAVAAAIVHAGGIPAYVEIDDDTMLMSPRALEETLRQRPVRAVVVVHMYGSPAAMTEIVEISSRYHVEVIEDCAQAHGAKLSGRSVGTFGSLAAFSFYPTKNLGAFGDGGAVFTRTESFAHQVRLLREYGWGERYVSSTRGRNSRLDEMQAAILRVRLPTLDSENAIRAGHAARYVEQLSSAPLKLPRIVADGESVWHQFAVRTARREAVRAGLLEDGIACGVLYPVPIHRQPAYLDPVSLPVTEQACAEVLCLPCHAGLGKLDVDRVITSVLERCR